MVAGPHFDQLMSLQRWAALMGTGTTESNLFYPLTVVQHMLTGAGGGGKGRPSSQGKKKKIYIYIYTDFKINVKCSHVVLV